MRLPSPRCAPDHVLAPRLIARTFFALARDQVTDLETRNCMQRTCVLARGRRWAETTSPAPRTVFFRGVVEERIGQHGWCNGGRRCQQAGHTAE